MAAWVLIVLFGFASSQSSYAISGIASQAECERLGKEVKLQLPAFANVTCHAYQTVKP